MGLHASVYLFPASLLVEEVASNEVIKERGVYFKEQEQATHGSSEFIGFRSSVPTSLDSAISLLFLGEARAVGATSLSGVVMYEFWRDLVEGIHSEQAEVHMQSVTGSLVGDANSMPSAILAGTHTSRCIGPIISYS